MIFGFDQRSSKLIHPQHCSPVAHGHEDLGILEVSGDGVDWPQMPVVVAETGVYLHQLLGFLVGDYDGTLLGADDVFGGCLRAVLESSGTNGNLLPP
jgi:hypothetical protein